MANDLPGLLGAFGSRVDGFVHSPGFGGLAAVAAAAVAYIAARTGVRAQDHRADEDRWWDQAKWAADRMSSSTVSHVALGIATFHFLLDHAPDSQASAFVRAAVLPVVDQPDIDEEAPVEAHLDEGQEGPA